MTNETTRDDLIRALRAVLPYAESRAEDMQETAQDCRESATMQVIAWKQANEATEQADKATEAVNDAKAVLSELNADSEAEGY